MIPALIGRKVGMTRVIDASGEVTPVTVVKAGPCTVLQVKTVETDGYNAVQLGFEDVKPHRSTMPLIGHAGKAGTGPKRVAREIRLNDAPELELGSVVTVDQFSGDEVGYVDVTGNSKGRGYAGVMRRWNMGGQPASHGTERKHRSPGSIGGMAQRGRGRCIKKGKRMAGHWGDERITQRCLKLVAVDTANNLLLVKGSVPGPEDGLLFVRVSKTRSVARN
ncbi:MAG TPA: 50S ribosomal protein L3 [Phycisphaerae bacterium]|nr:50S ribosomal protein L3 [Phycisphaerales bacterium]HRX86433.1 50S ribosomal protein L3 [Phycisphaerae bacterium]